MAIVDQYGQPISAPMDGVPINSNWWHWAASYVTRMFNPDSIPITEYDRIYNTDETVFSGCQILTHSILSKIGEYENRDPDQEAFIRKQFQTMYGSIKRAFAEILTGVFYGFSLSEILLKKQGKFVGLRAIQTLHPQTIMIDLIKEGELKNQVRTFYQHYGSQNAVELPPSKCIHFVHEGLFGNPYGSSRLKRAWKSMFIKDVLLRVYGTCLERYGTPITVGTCGNIAGEVNYQGVKYTGAEFMGKMLDSLGKSGSLVVPTGSTAEIKYAPAGLGADFLEAIRYCNRSIHQAIGLPSLIADAGTVGSHSLGQEHASTMERILESIMDDLIECILEQLIRPLIDINFGPQDDYGDFATVAFDPISAKATAEACKVLIDAQIVSPDRLADMNHMRERNDLPPLTEEDLSPDYPAMAPSQMLPPVDVPPVINSQVGRAQARVMRKAARQARFFKPLPRELLAEVLPMA